jgi:F-type H+-transporting ATPase subunit b
MIELLKDEHFWVGVALVLLLAVLWKVGVHTLVWKTLGDAGAKVQAQLDEAAKLRAEAQTLLEQIKAQRADSERIAGEMLANAKAEARRLEAEAKVKLAEQIKRRGELAERKIASAEAQAAADVKAAAADLAAQMAEQLLAARITGAKTDPLVDNAIGQMASKLQ